MAEAELMVVRGDGTILRAELLSHLARLLVSISHVGFQLN